MNELAQCVDDYINSKGIKKVWIAEQLGISQQLLYRLQKKKNFGVADANRILTVIDCHIEYNIVSNKVNNG